MMDKKNELTLIFDSRTCNEGMVRVSVAAFCTQLNPTLEEISDLKTAVSEAVTNAIIHGYEGKIYHEEKKHKIKVKCAIEEKEIFVDVQDEGIGIPDISKAMEPMYTTKPEQERSGMGFTFMEAFMDEIQVESEPGKGTIVRMKKRIGR